MNSLEWINKLIKEKKTDIDVHKNILHQDNSRRVYHNKVIKECEECIDILVKIKTDLEAWGIVQYGIDCKSLGEGKLRIKYRDNDFMGLDKFEIKTIVKSLGGKYEE